MIFTIYNLLVLSKTEEPCKQHYKSEKRETLLVSKLDVQVINMLGYSKTQITKYQENSNFLVPWMKTPNEIFKFLINHFSYNVISLP